jgi:hypothetical protein
MPLSLRALIDACTDAKRQISPFKLLYPLEMSLKDAMPNII